VKEAGSPGVERDAAMTRALEEAFEVASRLPAEAQDALAAAILEEVYAEESWNLALSANPAALERLADEALPDEVAARTEPLDPEEFCSLGRGGAHQSAFAELPQDVQPRAPQYSRLVSARLQP